MADAGRAGDERRETLQLAAAMAVGSIAARRTLQIRFQSSLGQMLRGQTLGLYARTGLHRSAALFLRALVIAPILLLLNVALRTQAGVLRARGMLLCRRQAGACGHRQVSYRSRAWAARTQRGMAGFARL